MKNARFALAIACTILLAAAVSTAAEKTAWFDLEGCDMCSKMSAQKGLMEHMQWENHLIKNGMMSVTTVDPGYAEAFEKAEKEMGAMQAKMGAGEKVHLCGFCNSMGGLMMKGANMEQIKTANGQIMLMTSSDPEVVKAIQQHGQRTIDEFVKMVAAEEEGRAHEGHAH